MYPLFTFSTRSQSYGLPHLVQLRLSRDELAEGPRRALQEAHTVALAREGHHAEAFSETVNVGQGLTAHPPYRERLGSTTT